METISPSTEAHWRCTVGASRIVPCTLNIPQNDVGSCVGLHIYQRAQALQGGSSAAFCPQEEESKRKKKEEEEKKKREKQEAEEKARGAVEVLYGCGTVFE